MSTRTICVLGALALGVTVHGAAWAQVPVLPDPATEHGPREPAAAAPPTAPAVAPLPPPPAAPTGRAAPSVTTPAVPPPSGVSVAVPPGYKLVPISEARRAVPYEDGDPIPAGYHLRREPRRGLVIAGSIVMGLPWMFSVTGAAADDFEHKSGFLLVPGIGPWLMLLAGGAQDSDCAPGGDLCATGKSGLRSVLVLDGLMQSAGAVMLTLGLLYPRQVLVPNPRNVSVLPTRVGEHGYGLGAVGTF